MKKDIEYYKQHPIEYLEKVCDIKLFDWQKQILDIIINRKGIVYKFPIDTAKNILLNAIEKL